MPNHYKPHKPWNRVSLHRQLLALLERPTTTLEFKTQLNGYAAHCIFDDKFPPYKITIIVDANDYDRVVHNVEHELIHVILSELVVGKFDGTLEEVVIMALSEYMYEYIKADKKRLAKWDKLIKKKLKEGEVGNFSLMELADRKKDERKE